MDTVVVQQQTIKTRGMQPRVELLRQILIKEQSREIAYDEAVDVGESLLTLFEVLAEAV